MKVDTYSCDVCEVQKGATNHWFVGGVFGDTGAFVQPWAAATTTLSNNVHLCGLDCAAKWLLRKLEKTA